MRYTFLEKHNFYRSLSFFCFLQLSLTIFPFFNYNSLNDYSPTIVIILLDIILYFGIHSMENINAILNCMEMKHLYQFITI